MLTLYAISVIALVLFLFAISEVMRWKNKQLAEEEYRLTRRLEGAKMVQHALAHLEPEGFGHDNEFSAARMVLEYALHSLVFGR